MSCGIPRRDTISYVRTGCSVSVPIGISWNVSCPEYRDGKGCTVPSTEFKILIRSIREHSFFFSRKGKKIKQISYYHSHGYLFAPLTIVHSRHQRFLKDDQLSDKSSWQPYRAESS